MPVIVMASNPDSPAGKYIYSDVLDANFNSLTVFFD